MAIAPSTHASTLGLIAPAPDMPHPQLPGPSNKEEIYPAYVTRIVTISVLYNVIIGQYTSKS